MDEAFAVGDDSKIPEAYCGKVTQTVQFTSILALIVQKETLRTTWLCFIGPLPEDFGPEMLRR